eukprot:jgi/Mesen1/5202/ME000258S04295
MASVTMAAVSFMVPSMSLNSGRSAGQVASTSSARSQLFGCTLRMNVSTRKTIRVASAIVCKTPQELDNKLEALIQEAKDLCATGSTGECAAMWDEIEEISANAAHKRDAAKGGVDPLEKFCEDSPEADECRTYED